MHCLSLAKNELNKYKELNQKTAKPARSYGLPKIHKEFLNIPKFRLTAWKVSKYRVFSGPYFPVFRLNTEIYSVNLRIQSECRKIRTRKDSVFGHISRGDLVLTLPCRKIFSRIITFVSLKLSFDVANRAKAIPLYLFKNDYQYVSLIF